MKRLLNADLFALRRGKLFYLMIAGAAFAGLFIPGLYYLLFSFFDLIYDTAGDALGSGELASFSGLLESLKSMMNPDTVFVSSIPFSSGFGLFVPAAVSFFCGSQFSNGIIRNKIIAGHRRTDIYFSLFLSSLLISIPSFFVYTASTFLFTYLIFGEFSLTATEIIKICLVALLIYIVYTSVAVSVTFITKKVPVSMITSIVLPIALGTVFSFASAMASSMPELILYLLGIFPSFQTGVITAMPASGRLLAVAVSADCLWTALITVSGAVAFSKSDVK